MRTPLFTIYTIYEAGIKRGRAFLQLSDRRHDPVDPDIYISLGKRLRNLVEKQFHFSIARALDNSRLYSRTPILKILPRSTLLQGLAWLYVKRALMGAEIRREAYPRTALVQKAGKNRTHGTGVLAEMTVVMKRWWRSGTVLNGPSPQVR